MIRFIVGVCLIAAALPAWAQNYPTRPIRALTATSAGGTSDVFMRLLGQEVARRWGQTVVVENRPGGAMNVGGEACAQSANDGYTICILPPETLAYNQYLFKSIPFDPAKDFTPITNPFFTTQVLVVNASLKVHSLAELAALSKAKPKTLSYTAASVPLIAFMNRWTKATDADIVKVPFRGGAEAVNGVLGGSTPVAFFGLANWLSFIKNGTVNALAVDSEQRSPLLPNVPTLTELGYGANLTRLYFGIVAPAGTPQPIVHKLYTEFAAVGKDVNFRQKHMVDVGLEPIFDTPEQFGAFLKEDRNASARIVKEAGMGPQ
ncbi:MAG: tripartite tricarboxylate transporter substrate binding protein [Xanthobacteraceae bacterium]